MIHKILTIRNMQKFRQASVLHSDSSNTMSRTPRNAGTSVVPGTVEIIELAKLLRDTGDKVLSASSKLSLSTQLLANLNESFSLIVNETDDLECSFQVCNSSRNEVSINSHLACLRFRSSILMQSCIIL